MANLKKPASCQIKLPLGVCGGREFIHEFNPERWVCCTCGNIAIERPTRNQTGVCRECGAKRDEVPFSKYSNICLACKRAYNKGYGIENKERIIAQHRESYQRDKPKRILAVKTAIQRSPESFLRHLSIHLRKYSKQKAVRRKNLNPACLDVQIDYDYLLDLYKRQDGKCALTGVEMTHVFNNFRSMSVDRIDSSQGYIPGNVQLVCQFINTAKRHFSNADVLSFLDDVVRVSRLAQLSRPIIERVYQMGGLDGCPNSADVLELYAGEVAVVGEV